jgi:hypothetical protein
MTEEEKHAEKMKMVAASCYRELDWALKAEDAVRAIVEKRGADPVFRQWMADMGLSEKLDAFVARPSVIDEMKRRRDGT